MVVRLRELEERQRKIANQMAGLQPVPRQHSAVMENRLAERRRLLRLSTSQGGPSSGACSAAG